MLSEWLLVKNQLFVNFRWSQKLYMDFQACRVWHPSYNTVQGSATIGKNQGRDKSKKIFS